MKNELSVKGAAMEKKVALVTGASRGIGRQISLTLAKEGMFVVVNYCGSEARAKNVLEEIRKNGKLNYLYKRYFGKHPAVPHNTTKYTLIKKGDISPFDKLFRKESKKLGWDWRLLAALVYTES